ncbi:DNA polymerase type-X family protein pol4 [Cladobotryum mycophilum]|uniref:DNA polymerase n=1 Tax=Cladobotryum mycophilum TaxID=491253 RepID=A0ABR0SV97_9HYPO
MAPELPCIFLLPTHLEPNELHQMEDSVSNLTYNIREANVVVGKISKRERALFELRRLKLETEEVYDDGDSGIGSAIQPNTVLEPSPKRRKVTESDPAGSGGSQNKEISSRISQRDGWGNIIMVVKLAWLTDCLQQDNVLPVDSYLLYRGRMLPSKSAEDKGPTTTKRRTKTRQKQLATTAKPCLYGTNLGIQERTSESQLNKKSQAMPVAISSSSSEHSPQILTRRPPSRGHAQPPRLLHETTSEHDNKLPPVPVFLETLYSCQRSSPVDPPNAAFVEELKAIRTLRLLEGDQVGVRAYSTSIATLSAYPYPLQRPRELARLPGCGAKIAELYQQWTVTGHTSETTAAATDPRLAVLRKFYGIWGVGDTTAREFYNKGWRDIDDVVEYGWDSLSRVQQIGIKYHEEFQLKIPRTEVEAIADVILSHGRNIDPGFQMVIVGGYRRGKQESGDVDVILSHKDEKKTHQMIDKIVIGLEKGSFITHTLSLSMRNSERGQAPLAWKGEGRKAGSGFDTLDKAMVVWQDPNGMLDTATGTVPHRRVDIIISPWKTVGCAVLGWSGATTFERDLRRYCKMERGLKFDSSGIRSRANGSWVDLEGMDGTAPDMETAEKRVFEGLGLPWRPPSERCTG